MSRTLVIPDHLYARLDAEARSAGLASVEALLAKLVRSLPGGSRPQSAHQDRNQGGHPGPVSREKKIGPALDSFIGDWSQHEEAEFLEAVAVFDQIDESLWA